MHRFTLNGDLINTGCNIHVPRSTVLSCCGLLVSRWHIVASTPDPFRHANIMVCMFFTQGDARFAKFDDGAAAPLQATATATADSDDDDDDDGCVPLAAVVIDGVEVEAREEDLAAAFAFDSESDDDSGSDPGKASKPPLTVLT